MSELPRITIVMTTYLPSDKSGEIRKKAVQKTLLSWAKWLDYDAGFYLHVADDGSEYEVIEAGSLGYSSWWADETFSRQERHGVGASLNAGFKKAFERSPLVFYGVDDWSLTQEFDLTPWAKLLMEREDVGMVRLGPPHPGTRGSIEAFTDDYQSWCLRLERYGFAFGHRPALYHKRMIDTYGWFAEDQNALECERLYAEKFVRTAGPAIVLALPHPWRHLDSVELAYMEPGNNT